MTQNDRGWVTELNLLKVLRSLISKNYTEIQIFNDKKSKFSSTE